MCSVYIKSSQVVPAFVLKDFIVMLLHCYIKAKDSGDYVCSKSNLNKSLFDWHLNRPEFILNEKSNAIPEKDI